MQRPQPIGVFPGMAGFFLLPPASEASEGEQRLSLLLHGHLPDAWPESWQFFAAAIAGRSEEEVMALLPEGPEGIYNRFVLSPLSDTYASAKEAVEGEISLLLDAVAWRLGICDAPPPYQDTDGEVRAFLLATQAYARFQQKDWSQGLDIMLEAAETVKHVSPVFSARLYAEWAATKQMLGDCGQDLVAGYRTALALLEASSFQEARAELWFQLGTAYHNGVEGRGNTLMEAVKCYHEALKVYQRNTHPEEYAMTHMNMALAYLAMPSRDRGSRLRTAVAIQSLREALRIFQKETHPQFWASATVNLANALQHAGTSHPEENLWEAVALYEEVLEVRRPEEDPVAYARVLANQGNALAHLGAFSRAVPRLQEAQRYFQEHGEDHAAEAVADMLAEIARRRQEHEAKEQPAGEQAAAERGSARHGSA